MDKLFIPSLWSAEIRATLAKGGYLWNKDGSKVTPEQVWKEWGTVHNG